MKLAEQVVDCTLETATATKSIQCCSVEYNVKNIFIAKTVLEPWHKQHEVVDTAAVYRG